MCVADKIDGEECKILKRTVEVNGKVQSNKNVKLILKSSIAEKMQILSEAKFIISGRFHPVIIGKLHNRNCIGLAYAQKMNNLNKKFTRKVCYDVKDIFNGNYNLYDIVLKELHDPALFIEPVSEIKTSAMINLKVLSGNLC
jgi:polysaccharide pyruvyl transferase WcaK-like protein